MHIFELRRKIDHRTYQAHNFEAVVKLKPEKNPGLELSRYDACEHKLEFQIKIKKISVLNLERA